MQIILHTGAHFTEEERLAKCLLRNKQDFSARGVAVPGPSRYRKLLREALSALEGTAPAPGARDVMLDAILDDERADRVILTHPHYFGAPRACLRQGLMYQQAPERIAQTAQLFSGDRIEMFMAMRNPASFLPKVFAQTPHEDWDGLFGDWDPLQLRWSDTFRAVRAAAPTVPITVWCNEDAPLIWAQIVRAMAGLPKGEKIIGGFDLLNSIMSPEGMKRFRAYLKTYPVMTDVQKQRVMSAFLDKFAVEDALEEEIDMPGWTEQLVDDLTDAYDRDIAEVARIPGVTLLAP